MKRVTEILTPLPGVANVEIDFPNRLAHCKVQDSFSADNAIAKLADGGYEDSKLTAAATN